MKDTTKVWVAMIPEIFGYGLMVFHSDEDTALKLLKKSYFAWRNSRGSDTTFDTAYEEWAFKTAYEDWGGRHFQVEMGKLYNDDISE